MDGLERGAHARRGGFWTIRGQEAVLVSRRDAHERPQREIKKGYVAG